MKNIFKILFLFLITLNIQSQEKLKTAGYLGKRTTIEFNMGLAYMHSTKMHENAFKNQRIFRANMHPEFTFAYTIKRNTDIGFKIGYDRVKFKFPDYLVFSDNKKEPEIVYNADLSLANGYGSTIYNSEQYFDLINTENIGRSFNYQIFFRFYNKKYIAPIGFYHQISAGINRISFKDNEIEGSFREEPNVVNTIKLQKYNMYQLSYFIGNKSIIKNEMYLNVGVEVNLFNKRGLSSFFNSNYANDRSDTYHRYLPRKLGNTVMLSQVLEFKIGIGKIF